MLQSAVMPCAVRASQFVLALLHMSVVMLITPSGTAARPSRTAPITSCDIVVSAVRAGLP